MHFSRASAQSEHWKQPHSGFELKLPIPFPKTITIKQHPPSLDVDIIIFLFTQPFHFRQDARKLEFLSKVHMVWIQFSFSHISCHTRAKEPCLPCYFPITDWFLPFTKWKSNGLVQNLNSRHWVHFQPQYPLHHMPLPLACPIPKLTNSVKRLSTKYIQTSLWVADIFVKKTNYLATPFYYY